MRLVFLIAILLIVCLLTLHILIRNLEESFDNPDRLAKLTETQKLEVQMIIGGAWGAAIVVDQKVDTDAAEVAKGIFTILQDQTIKLETDTDIRVLKNRITNKAAENRNISVAFTVLEKYLPQAVQLGKRYKDDPKGGEQAGKELAIKGIREILRKLPKFPFIPEVKKQVPEAFAEAPKPSATECKKYFKCSSISSD